MVGRVAGVLAGVVDQVADDLLNHRRVGLDRSFGGKERDHDQFLAVRRDAIGPGLDAAHPEVVDHNRLNVAIRLALLKLGEVETLSMSRCSRSDSIARVPRYSRRFSRPGSCR